MDGFLGDGLQGLAAWGGVVQSLLKILAEITLGVFAGQLVEALGWTRRASRLTRPLLALGGLPQQVNVSFATAFVSGSAANASLVAWRDQGVLTDRQVTAGALLNTFPNQFNHLPSQLAPLALLVGPRVAGAYFGVQMGAGLARTVATLLWSRWAVAKAGGMAETSNLESPGGGNGWKGALGRAWRNSARTLKRVLRITIPVCTAFVVLNRWGAFRGLEAWLGGVPVLEGLSPDAAGVVVAHLASLLTAAAAAAELIHTGALDDRTAALVLLVGSLLAMPLRTLRHSLGIYVGVFGPRRGVQIQILSQGLRFCFGALGIAVLALLWG